MAELIPAEVGIFTIGLGIVIVCIALMNIAERIMYGED